MTLLSSLTFGSYLTYAPRGDSEIATKSRNLRDDLKHERGKGNPPVFLSRYITQEIGRYLDTLPFNTFFGPDVSLIPVPKSTLMQKDEL